MPTDAQLLKAYGHLPTVRCDQLDSAAIDPLMMTALEDRFCGHPDHPDQEIAYEDDPERLSHALGCDVDWCTDLIVMHQSMVEAATGRGSFPSGCYPAYPDNHAARVFIDLDAFPSHQRRPVTDTELLELAGTGVWWSREQLMDMFAGKPMVEVAMALTDEAYRRRGCAHIRADDGSDGNHNIHVLSVRIPGSTIGLGWFNDGRCGSHVLNKIDTDYRPGLHGLANLLCHECGHNHGLPHTFAGQNSHHGIMSYSPKYPFVGYSTGQTPYDRPRDPSLTQLIQQYGDEPVPGTDTPTIPERVPEIRGTLYGESMGGKVIIRGELQSEAGHEYIVAPKRFEPGEFKVVVKPSP